MVFADEKSNSSAKKPQSPEAPQCELGQYGCGLAFQQQGLLVNESNLTSSKSTHCSFCASGYVKAITIC